MTVGASRRLPALLIVSLTYGCDNVEWGGAELHIQAPPPAVVGAPPDTAQSAEAQQAEVPIGPVLFLGERDSTGLRLIPVGEILDDSIGAFPSESQAPGYRARFGRSIIPQGAEFVLFSKGVRVGSFTVQVVETDETFCVPRPAARGIVELVPEALAENRFLAIPRQHASSQEWQPYEIVEIDRPQRDATLSLPGMVISQLNVERPPNFLDTRWDMQAFRSGGQNPPMVAVTHLIRDRMRIERPPPSAYSLFILGAPEGTGYVPAFHWYRQVGRQGKGAPRFFEQMDWDGDGEPEVLLEVLGEQHRWLAAVDQRSGTWTLVFEEPCGASAPPVTP